MLKMKNKIGLKKIENYPDDKWKHGTMPIPHKSKFTKLKPEDIPIIRKKHQDGLSCRRISNIFKTSHTTIIKIIKNERWRGY